MKISGALVSTAALIVLASTPRWAEAQCVVTYSEFNVNTAEEKIDTWAYLGDYFNTAECSPGSYWGYWEHHYFPTAQITSPAQNSAYGEDYQVMAFGGGSAMAFTTLPIDGDPGIFQFLWCWLLACTGLGDYLVNMCDDDGIDVQPVPVVVNLTFDDGPTSDSIENYSHRVIAALAANSVQPLAPATFFVQTHVSNRGGDPGGIGTMEMAIDAGHPIQIHTGSDEDHVLHTVRVGQAAYPPWGGANGLESDLIRAKDRIDDLDGGSVPALVRPPIGAYNGLVLETYDDPDVNLDCVYWNVDSGDTNSTGPITVESIKGHLEDDIEAALAVGQRRLVVLFHDTKSITSNNLEEFLQQIETVIEDAGYAFAFVPLPEQQYECD